MLDKNKFEYFFFAFFIKLFKLIGLNKTRKLGKFAGSLIYYLIPIRRKVVIDNLTKAFPRKNSKEIRTIALRNYQNIAITFVEFMYIPSSSKKEIASIVDIHADEDFDRLLEKKKGFNKEFVFF